MTARCTYNSVYRVRRHTVRHTGWTTDWIHCLLLLLKCCFTSTETVGLLGTPEPKTSNSTFAQLLSSPPLSFSVARSAYRWCQCLTARPWWLRCCLLSLGWTDTRHSGFSQWCRPPLTRHWDGDPSRLWTTVAACTAGCRTKGAAH